MYVFQVLKIMHALKIACVTSIDLLFIVYIVSYLIIAVYFMSKNYLLIVKVYIKWQFISYNTEIFTVFM